MLTSKQRARLRSLANEVSPIIQIGKGEIDSDIIRQVDEALKAREIVKITVLKTCALEPEEVLSYLAAKTDSEPVQRVGRKITLYRKSCENPRIEL